MNYSIRWLPESERTFDKVISYLDEYWSIKEVEKFINRTDQVIDFISRQPKQYVYSRKKDAYRAVISKQISLFYRISGSEVELLAFWDNRQDPSALVI